MWSGVLNERPELPQRSEASELVEASRPASTSRPATVLCRAGEYEVDGVLMTRPFKVVGIGPVSLFVDELDQAEKFYTGVLGFTVRQRVEWQGHRGLVLYSGSEYYTLALYEAGLRSALGLQDRTDSMALGFQVANYRQLRAAVAHLIAEAPRRSPCR